jgi:phosphoribosylanthranilate isomerase
VILSGGLTPDNVGRAVAVARPFAVDVNSGVESRPGTKDSGRVERFIRAARAAASEMS